MMNMLFAPVLVMAIASAGMAIGAVIHLMRGKGACLNSAKLGRMVVLGAVVALSWLSLAPMLTNADAGTITEVSTLLAALLGLGVGVLPVLLALTSQPHPQRRRPRR